MKVSHVFVVFVLTIVSAHATEWIPVLRCDGGAAVLDVNRDERRNVQLVIRNNNILSYLYRSGAINLSWGQAEYIGGGWVSRGVFHTGDFSELVGGAGDGRNVIVRREGSGLKVLFERVTSWTEYPEGCRGAELSMACEASGESRSNHQELATWYFRDCR
jgi:hypothetical protein